MCIHGHRYRHTYIYIYRSKDRYKHSYSQAGPKPIPMISPRRLLFRGSRERGCVAPARTPPADPKQGQAKQTKQSQVYYLKTRFPFPCQDRFPKVRVLHERCRFFGSLFEALTGPPNRPHIDPK